jgi:adhesin/invasin
MSLKFTNALTGSGDETLKITSTSSGVQYQPATVATTTTVTINAADAQTLKVYKKATADYDACAGTGTATAEISSITISGAGPTYSKTIYGNENVGAGDPEAFFVQLEDAFGNSITGANIYVESDTDELTPTFTPSSAVFTTTGTMDVSYSMTGTDVLTFQSDVPGVTPATVNVTVSTTAVALGTIEVLPAQDNLLINGEIPVIVRAFNGNGLPFDFNVEGLTFEVSNPNIVRVFEKDRSTAIDNGDEVTDDDTDGEYVFSLQPMNTTADVTLSFRNTSGTVKGEATVSIVSSISDIPATVATIDAVSSLTMEPAATATWTVTVSDADGNALSGRTVTFASDNTSVVTVTSSAVTGTNGQATATLTAGSIESSANITATSEGVSTSVAVTVTEEVPVEPTPIGEATGPSSTDVTATEQLALNLNVTPEAGDTPVQEWLAINFTIGGVDFGWFVYSPAAGFVPVGAEGWEDVQFNADDFGGAVNGVVSLLTLSMGDLTLGAGDTFTFGYAYTTTASDFNTLVFNNVNTINVQ